MTRRNQKRFSERKHNHNQKQLVKMLNIRKLNFFRYDVKEIFAHTDMDQKVWSPMLASIVTKASRLSIKEAIEYIHELENQGELDNDTVKGLIQLLDKYTRWR